MSGYRFPNQARRERKSFLTGIPNDVPLSLLFRPLFTTYPSLSLIKDRTLFLFRASSFSHARRFHLHVISGKETETQYSRSQGRKKGEIFFLSKYRLNAEQERKKLTVQSDNKTHAVKLSFRTLKYRERKKIPSHLFSAPLSRISTFLLLHKTSSPENQGEKKYSPFLNSSRSPEPRLDISSCAH